MNNCLTLARILEDIKTTELWGELARRLGVRFGKIQVAIHDGRPSKYATIDMRVSTEEEPLLESTTQMTSK
jgi:hypothetical protein